MWTTQRPLAPPLPRLQGGFARCFKFTNLDRQTTVAGKVVDKTTLARSKAKMKVRGEMGEREGAAM